MKTDSQKHICWHGWHCQKDSSWKRFSSSTFHSESSQLQLETLCQTSSLLLLLLWMCMCVCTKHNRRLFCLFISLKAIITSTQQLAPLSRPSTHQQSADQQQPAGLSDKVIKYRTWVQRVCVCWARRVASVHSMANSATPLECNFSWMVRESSEGIENSVVQVEIRTQILRLECWWQ